MNLTHLKADLTRDEGYKTHAYRSNTGQYTIGVGHFLGTIPRMFDLTTDEIDALLERDIEHATERARLFNVQPDFWLDRNEVRQRALVNMSFNLGERLFGFKKFQEKLRSGWYSEAA